MDNSHPSLVGAAWKHRLIFSTAIALFIAGGVAVGALSRDTSVHSAQATIVLQDPASLETGGANPRFIAEQAEIMRSPLVAEAAATKLTETPIEPPITADELLSSILIDSTPNSSLLYIGAVDDDPERAIAMVNGLAEAYQEVMRLQATQTSDAALDRIDAQLEALDERFVDVAGEIRIEREANDDLTELERQAAESVSRIVELQAQLINANEASAPAIRAQIADHRSRLDTFRQAEASVGNSPAMLALLDEQERLIERRTELLRSRDQIAIDAELAAGVVALLDTADVAYEFVESNMRRTLAVAAVLGLITAFALSYLIEVRRRTFGGRLEPEGILGAPLLADVPVFSDEGLKTRLPVLDSPRSAAAEGFRFAAASIQDSMRAMGAKSVMMVGSTLGQGKSTSVVNTTMANARRGHSVLLIDCDFGNQDATQLLLDGEQGPEVGLLDVVESAVLLNSATSHIQLDSGVTFDVLSRGGRSGIAANVLSAKEAGVVFEAAAAKYDIVFVDAPPLLQVAYASTVASYVDALVVVVAHESPVRELEELVKRLQLIGTPVLGYIYNRSPLRKEMTAVDGSMMDILGEGTGRIAEGSDRTWWRKVRA